MQPTTSTSPRPVEDSSSEPLQERTATCAECREDFTQRRTERRFPAPAAVGEARFIWTPEMCDLCAQKNRERRQEFEVQRQRSEREQFIQRIGVPPMVRARLAEIVPDAKTLRLREAIAQLIAGKSSFRWMLLYGPKGSGKTTESGGAAIEFAERTERCARFVDFADLLLTVRETYGKESTKTELSILKPLREAALLVIDDVAANKVSQHGADVLYAVLNFRYERGLRTILTSNFSPSEIAARLAPADDAVVAERICDRIIEMSLIVKMDSPSRRHEQGQRTDRTWEWAERDAQQTQRFVPLSFASTEEP